MIARCLFLDGIVILAAVSTPVDWPELEESLAANRAGAAVASGSELDRWFSDDVIGRLWGFNSSCGKAALDWGLYSKRSWGLWVRG